MVSVDMLTTVHNPYDTRIYHKESRTLTDAGYDVSILAHHPCDESVDGIDIVSIGTADSRTERWKHLLRMYRTAAARESDVYHFHDPELLPVGVWLSRTTDAAIIYDIHEDYANNAIKHKDWIPDIITPALEYMVPTIQSACVTQFDRVVTATEWIAEGLEANGCEAVVPVRNFPITEEITIDDLSEEPDWEHTLVYVGSISKARGIDNMLHLIKELRRRDRDVGLWIIGHFNELETAARRYIRKNNLGDAVHLFGRIEYKQMFSYLAAADIGLILADASRYKYVIPTKIFEYMYTRLPVVATDTFGPRSYLPSTAGVFVNESDTVAQADIVEELLDDPEKREQMGEIGRTRVINEYSWEAESETLLKMYGSLCKQ